MLISQPGSDYQITRITLDAGHTRDIIHLLLDIHSVLGQICLDPDRPDIAGRAGELLRYTASPYTLPALIAALDDVINQLTWTMGEAFSSLTPPPNHPADNPRQPLTASRRVGPDQSATTPPPPAPGGARSQENTGARSG